MQIWIKKGKTKMLYEKHIFSTQAPFLFFFMRIITDVLKIKLVSWLQSLHVDTLKLFFLLLNNSLIHHFEQLYCGCQKEIGVCFFLGVFGSHPVVWCSFESKDIIEDREEALCRTWNVLHRIIPAVFYLQLTFPYSLKKSAPAFLA